MKNYSLALILLLFSSYCLAQDLPGSGQGGDGFGTPTPTSSIDMYIYVLIAIAVLLIFLFAGFQRYKSA